MIGKGSGAAISGATIYNTGSGGGYERYAMGWDQPLRPGTANNDCRLPAAPFIRRGGFGESHTRERESFVTVTNR